MQLPDPSGTATIAAFFEATVRVATPLGLAALGETATERSGVINVGLEGAMLSGALAAALGALGLGGAWGGLAAAALVLAQAGTFAERMTAGRGFIAIAIVVLGRWNPLGAFAAALVFGAASALQYAFQAAGLDVPYQFFLMAPYLVTLLALAGVGGRARAPAALGKNYSVMSDG